MLDSPHIVFAGGGSLGNIYPGLAIAEKVADRLPQAQITFAGSNRTIERHTVRAAGYNYIATPAQPTPDNPLAAVRFVTDNFVGFCTSRWMLKEQRVSLVVGLGGYASTATVRAALGRGIPFVLVEQNANPSKTTRWLAGSAEAVCIAFDEARSGLAVESQTLLTGIPARPSFERLYRQDAERGVHRQFDDNPQRERRLVVIGGAGGATSLNEQMPGVLKRLTEHLAGWRVIHQTGEGQLQDTEGRYQRAGVPALVVSHIDEPASLLFETDMVVCRPGGSMLAELAMAGAPSVLTPHLGTFDASHAANAERFAQSGSARVVDSGGSDERLADAMFAELASLLPDEARRHDMGEKARAFARPDAAANIAEVCCDLLGGTGRLAA